MHIPQSASLFSRASAAVTLATTSFPVILAISPCLYPIFLPQPAQVPVNCLTNEETHIAL